MPVNVKIPQFGDCRVERIIALDVGEKRVGVAVSDPLGCTAQPLTVLPRRPHAAFMEKLASLAAEYECRTILLGLPRRTTGEKGPEAQRVLALASEIKKKLNLSCETWDEWLTTVAAEKALIEGGVRREDRRQVIDMTAAALILEGYLNFLANRRKNENGS